MQEIVAIALATLTITWAGAVYAYILVTADDLPVLRAIMSLGLTHVPWHRLARATAQILDGLTSWNPAEAALRSWDRFRDWVDAGTIETTVRPYTIAMDPAYPEAPIVAVDHNGRVWESRLEEPRQYHGGDPHDPTNWAAPGRWTPPQRWETTDLPEPAMPAVAAWTRESVPAIDLRMDFGQSTADWLEQASERVVRALSEHRVVVLAESEELVYNDAPLTPVAPLDVRAAEILAHEENDAFVPVPARTAAGATEDWSPIAEVTQALPPVVLAQTPLDDEARKILASFDRLCGDARTVPDWEQEFSHEVDAYLEAAGVEAAEAHRRWRAGQLESHTGELPRVLLQR